MKKRDKKWEKIKAEVRDHTRAKHFPLLVHEGSEVEVCYACGAMRLVVGKKNNLKVLEI